MEIEQGTSQSFYATFADYDGSEVSILSSAIIISHRHGGSTTTDVNNVQMTQFSGSTYYYTFDFARNCDLGKYAVKYIGLYSDGTVRIGAEDIQLVARGAFEKTRGGTVKNPIHKDVWLPSEKYDIIGAIKEIQSTLVDINSIKGNLTDLKTDFVNTKKILDEEKEIDFNPIITRLSDIENNITKIFSEKGASNSEIKIDDKTFCDKIDRLSEKFSSTISSLKNTSRPQDGEIYDKRITLLISQIDDISKQIDLLGKATLKMLPKEKLEGLIQDEYDRGTIERIQEQG